MSVAKRSEAYDPALPTSSLISASFSHGRGQPLGIELADATLVALGERVPPRQGLGELMLDAGIVLAVDQRGEVPFGLEQLGVGEGVGGGGHGEGG